jgi:hypothetical protein
MLKKYSVLACKGVGLLIVTIAGFSAMVLAIAMFGKGMINVLLFMGGPS